MMLFRRTATKLIQRRFTPDATHLCSNSTQFHRPHPLTPTIDPKIIEQLEKTRPQPYVLYFALSMAYLTGIWMASRAKQEWGMTTGLHFF